MNINLCWIPNAILGFGTKNKNPKPQMHVKKSQFPNAILDFGSENSKNPKPYVNIKKSQLSNYASIDFGLDYKKTSNPLWISRTPDS